MKPSLIELAIQIIELEFSLERATSIEHEKDISNKILELKDIVRKKRQILDMYDRPPADGGDQYPFYKALYDERQAKRKGDY